MSKSKDLRSSPDGKSLGQREKSKKVFGITGRGKTWTRTEEKLLVEYMTNHTEDDWAGGFSADFWRNMSKYIAENSGLDKPERGWKSCQRKAVHLREKFQKLHVAEDHYGIDVLQDDVDHDENMSSTLSDIITSLQTLEPVCLMTVMDVAFKQIVEDVELDCPTDFLQLALPAMAHLQDKHKPNLIYLAAKGFGTMRTGGGDSRIPTDRMPYGVLEYSLQFFNASHTNQITCPPDLRKFTQTIYDEIGGKGLNLFTGPMFKAGDCTPGTRDQMKAKVNIPTVSRSTLNRDMKGSGCISGPYIQVW
ncbi:uncharacterized protein [Ptychodera flava]|uniref:uncharacterized protein isoform X2 n=1 Tax=Ptychodera flava TaxID=63121 RepID=UPI00396A5513